MAMHRGCSQKLNTVELFSSGRGQRVRDGDFIIRLVSMVSKRTNSIADHLRGHVPVAYDDISFYFQNSLRRGALLQNNAGFQGSLQLKYKYILEKNKK